MKYFFRVGISFLARIFFPRNQSAGYFFLKSPIVIKIGDYEINRVYDLKYLGIVLDDSLSGKTMFVMLFLRLVKELVS